MIVTRGPEVDELNVRVRLSSPESRDGFVAFAAALEACEEAICPGRSGTSGRSSVKPGSRPPAGNLDAAKLLRRIGRSMDSLVVAVGDLYRAMDPVERAEIRSWKKRVREMRAQVRAEAKVREAAGGRG